MGIVCGLDLHRQQITFDVVDGRGMEWRGRIWQPDRLRVRRWLSDLKQRAGGAVGEIAVEGCTGWRYVVEEISSAGFTPLLAEPAETQAARGPKRRAKTDRSDAALVRELLQTRRLPLSWIPPMPVLEWRERARLYKSLVDERSQWAQRIHAECYHHGLPVQDTAIRSDKTRALLCSDEVDLSPAARQRIVVAYRMIDAVDLEIAPLRLELTRFGSRQPACRALAAAHYGIGSLLAVPIWSELGDCRRFSNSDQVVRHAGLDVTVDSSDRRRANGHLAKQGPPMLRWALFEAATNASRSTSPDHDYYSSVNKRHNNGKIATISVARQFARRCFHVLRGLDPAEVYATPD